MKIWLLNIKSQPFKGKNQNWEKRKEKKTNWKNSPATLLGFPIIQQFQHQKSEAESHCKKISKTTNTSSPKDTRSLSPNFKQNQINFAHQIRPNFTIQPKYKFKKKQNTEKERELTVHWHAEYQPEDSRVTLGKEDQQQAADKSPTFLSLRLQFFL